MNHTEITLDFKTREKIIPRLPQVVGEPEMSIYRFGLPLRHAQKRSKPSKKLYTNNNVDTGWLGKIAAEILGSQYDYYG